MFGNEYDIVREFNAYFLDYQEQYDADTRWTDRIISSSGDWSGNVYDFYFRVYNKLIQDIKVRSKAIAAISNTTSSRSWATSKSPSSLSRTSSGCTAA